MNVDLILSEVARLASEYPIDVLLIVLLALLILISRIRWRHKYKRLERSVKSEREDAQSELNGLHATISDSLLSRDFEGRIVVTVEPFNWREIIKVLLDAGGIVKAVDEGENALRRFLPGAEPADGVYQLLLED